MNRKDGQFIMLIVFILLGLSISIQVKTILAEQKKKIPTDQKVARYQAQITKEKQLNDDMLKDVKAKQEKLNKYLKKSTNTKNSDSKMDYKLLEKYRLKAGLTSVKGRGITITLRDAVDVDEFDNASLYVIHDRHIVNLLNELKKLGAQAISINDERIISTSGVICAGPKIRVNNKRYTIPYVIKAIGNQDILFDAIDNSEWAIFMREFGITVAVERNSEVIVSKYNSDIKSQLSGLEVINK